jgi:hypothetical protein
VRKIELKRFNQLLLTRELGRDIGQKLPESERLLVDCRGVKAISPSFLDELIRTTAERGIAISFENVPQRTKHQLAILERASERRRLAQAV